MGCGAASPNCTLTPELGLSPASATANHAAAAPGNQQKFTADEGFTTAQAGCGVPQIVALVYPAWTVSDPLDVTISSAQDQTNGLAKCVNATAGPVTLTATEGIGPTALQKSVQLTCQ
jgi:hypothetical protein